MQSWNAKITFARVIFVVDFLENFHMIMRQMRELFFSVVAAHYFKNKTGQILCTSRSLW
jgi:hypothetical protein